MARAYLFEQAAIKQGLRESTIGRVIRKLEDEIGVALFIRYPDGVKLTNAGSKFLSRARMAPARHTMSARLPSARSNESLSPWAPRWKLTPTSTLSSGSFWR